MIQSPPTDPDTGRAIIRGLTLTHPWPAAILLMGKRIENRTWRPRQAGIFLALHGGRAPKAPRAGADGSRAWQDFGASCAHINTHLIRRGHVPRDPLRPYVTPTEPGRGRIDWPRLIWPGIVGVARLEGVWNDPSDPWAASGQEHWHLSGVTAFEHAIPTTGGLGLWHLDSGTLNATRAAYERATGKGAPF